MAIPFAESKCSVYKHTRSTMTKPTSVDNQPAASALYSEVFSLSKIQNNHKQHSFGFALSKFCKTIPLLIDSIFSLLTVLFLSGRVGGSFEKSGGLIRAGSVLAFMGLFLIIQSGAELLHSDSIFFFPMYLKWSTHNLYN